MFETICQSLRDNAAAALLPASLHTQVLTPDTCLIDLGIDSLGTMTLLADVAQRLSMPVPELDIDPTFTLGQLAEAMQQARETHNASAGVMHG